MEQCVGHQPRLLPACARYQPWRLAPWACCTAYQHVIFGFLLHSLLSPVLLVTWQRYKVLGMGKDSIAICGSRALALQQRAASTGARCRAAPAPCRMPLQIAHLLLLFHDSDTPD